MDYEDQLYGCAFGCPLKKRLEDCPFNEFDHLSFKEKVIHIKNLSKEKRESMILHHKYCSIIRKWNKDLKTI
jgi:hypothetical protein